MLVATDGEIVDVARIVDAEVVPDRWTSVSEDEAAEGFKAIDANRVLLITSPTVPAPIETLIGQHVHTGRNPIRYVTVELTGSRAAIVEVEMGDDEPTSAVDHFAILAEAARSILIEVAQRGETITYGTLAERLLDETGLTETRPIHWWIGSEVLTASPGRTPTTVSRSSRPWSTG